MVSYYHLAPIMLGAGSTIEPGNFGRIIKLYGSAHPLFNREMAYERIRQQRFCSNPSRLNCLFCFPSHNEAMLYRQHIKGFQTSILYEIESPESQPIFFDSQLILDYKLPDFDTNLIAKYWQGWNPANNSTNVVLRELLLQQPVTVIGKLIVD